MTAAARFAHQVQQEVLKQTKYLTDQITELQNNYAALNIKFLNECRKVSKLQKELNKLKKSQTRTNNQNLKLINDFNTEILEEKNSKYEALAELRSYLIPHNLINKLNQLMIDECLTLVDQVALKYIYVYCIFICM